MSYKVKETSNYPNLVHLAFASDEYVPTEEDWKDYEKWCQEIEAREQEEDFMLHYDRVAGYGDIDTDNVLLQFPGR